MSQRQLARRYANPVAAPVPGVPLGRSTPNLGWGLVREKATIDVESDLKPETKKKKVYWAWKRFVNWLEKEGMVYKGGLVIHGPFPHMDYKPPNVQKGSQGGTRLAARSVAADLGNNGKEDYVIEAQFLKREEILELPSDVAREIIGTRGIRAARKDS